MAYILLRYLHLIAVVVLAGGIIIENMATRPRITSEDVRNLARIDALCGLSVVLLLGFGLTLWFAVGKPADFYSTNPVFLAKLGLFGLLLAVASYPAVFFFRNRGFEGEELEVPKALLFCLRFELILLVLIPILAWLMARGVGLSG